MFDWRESSPPQKVPGKFLESSWKPKQNIKQIKQVPLSLHPSAILFPNMSFLPSSLVVGNENAEAIIPLPSRPSRQRRRPPYHSQPAEADPQHDNEEENQSEEEEEINEEENENRGGQSEEEEEENETQEENEEEEVEEKQR